MIALITSALSVLAIVLEMVVQNRQTPQEKRYDDTQQGRADIANDDADAVNGRIDRLLTRQPLSTGQSSDKAIAGSIGTILGVAAAIRSTGADTGTSGSVPSDKGE